MTESGRLVGSACFDRFFAPWLDRFDRSHFHVYLHEEVIADASAVYARVLDHLGLAATDAENFDSPTNARAAPRSRLVASTGKRAARFARRVGAEQALGIAKQSETIRRVLYRAPDDAEPTPLADDTATLRRFYRPSVLALSEMLDIDLAGAWGYS
jgi:hypothetical protein